MHDSPAVRSRGPRRALARRLPPGAVACALAIVVGCEPDIPRPPGVARLVRVSPRGPLLAVGDSLRLTASALDASGMTMIAGRNVQWTSDDPTVARLAAGGWLHGERLGSTLLHAAIDGVRDTTTVTVVSATVRAVRLSQDSAIMYVGDTRQLAAGVYGRGDSLITDRVLTWTSTAPLVVDVTQSGTVTATGAGTARVVASIEGRADTAGVIVITIPTGQEPRIALSSGAHATSAIFSDPLGGTTIDVTNGGVGTLTGLAVGDITYGAGASGWASATLDGTSAPTRLTIALNPGAFTEAGTYTATIPVTTTRPGVLPASVTVTATLRWSFARHVRPNLASCDGCHNAPFTYANLVEVRASTGATGPPSATTCGGATSPYVRVRAGDTTASLLYRKMAGTHPCGNIMGASQFRVRMIRLWILDGAPDN